VKKVAAMKITLRAARINLGLTRKEAAKQFDIHHMSLTKYEYDSTNVPHSFFIQLESVYGIPIENLYFGNEEDYIKTMKENLLKEVNSMT
jgi:transcriptional regulator with XRE-family HTH domain